MSKEREEKPDLMAALRAIAKEDGRYDAQAFQFMFEALSYTTQWLQKNRHSENEEERHVTGQELCGGIRRFAIEQFGYMAKAVFHSWGITRTDDFGEMVYLLIDKRLMAKRESDSIADFHEAYDFNTAFEDVFAEEEQDPKNARRRPQH